MKGIDIAKLIDDASRSPKAANKQEAYGILRRILEADDSEAFDYMETCRLLSYLMPSMPKKPRSDFEWVSRAVCPKGSLLPLRYVYSDGERMFGCDRHRLHVAPADREAGFYVPRTGDSAEVDAKFPDCDRITPTEGAPVVVTATERVIYVGGKIGFAVKIAGRAYQLCYIHDLLCGAESAPGTIDDSGKLRVDLDDDHLAVVMPYIGKGEAMQAAASQ